MANFSKNLKLTLDPTQPIDSLKIIEAELKKVNDLISNSNPNRRKLADLSKEQAEIQALVVEYEELIKAQQASTQSTTQNTTATNQNTTSVNNNTTANKKQIAADKELEKSRKAIAAANKSVTEAFIAVSKASFTAVGTFEQFLVPIEEQGALLGKLFQALGLVQTDQETYNAVKAVDIALTDAQTLSNIALTGSVEAIAIAEAEATVATRIFSTALATLGGPLTFFITAIAAVGTALFIFRDTVDDLIGREDRLYKKFVEVANQTYELERAQIAFNKARANGFDTQSAILKEQEAILELNKRSNVELQYEADLLNDKIIKIYELAGAYDAINEATLGGDFSPAVFTEGQKKQIDAFTKNKNEIIDIIKKRKIESEEIEKEISDTRIDNQLKTDNAILELQKKSLETSTTLEAGRQSSLLGLSQQINDLQAQFDKAIINQKQFDEQYRVLLEDRNNVEIKFSRDARLRALEEFKLERDLQIKSLEGRTDIEAELLVIELQRQKAQKELNTLILNEAIPAGERINKQKELELSYNKQLLAVQIKINEQIIDNSEALKDLSIEDLLTDLEKPGATLETDLTNRLKSIELKTENAVENLKQKYNELLVAATGNEKLIKSLEERRDLEIGILNNKSARETELAKKTTQLLIEQAKLKDIAFQELQAKELKRQLELDVTTFESRKELNAKLLELEVTRLEQERKIQLLQTTNEDEKKRINDTFDFIINKAKQTNATINEIAEESLIQKIFGSPAEVKEFIDGSNRVSASITGIANAIDQLDGFANDASGSFKAIVSSFSSLTAGAGDLVSTIDGLEKKLAKDLVGASDEAATALKEQFSKEKTAAIVAGVGETLNEITGLVVNTIVDQLNRQIEDIDSKLDDLKTKKEDLDDQIRDSQQKALDLEKELADAKAQDRERIINLIEQERLREKQLAADKKKFADQEKKLIEDKKELQRKAFIAKKAASIIEVAINTAVGVSAALTIPPPAGPILAAITGALGAAQAVVIASQPTPEFRKGGFGPTAKDDSTPVRAQLHANEYIVPAPIVRSPKYRPLVDELERARTKGYQSGGLVVPNESVNDQLQKTLDAAIALSQRPIYASITQINEEEARQIQIQQFVTLGS